MRTVFCALVVSAVVIWTGCGENNSMDGLVLPAVIMPLKAGNEWTYRRTVYNNDLPVSVDTSVLLIYRDTTIQNETWYILYASGDRQMLCNRDYGLWYWDIDSSAPCLLAKYPATVGDQWILYGDTVTVVSTNAKVSVPGGVYSCYQYLVSYSEHVVVDYGYYDVDVDRWRSYAPNVGLVKDSSFGIYPHPSFVGVWYERIEEFELIGVNLFE